MGNMLMNKRVEETILGGSTTNNESEEQSSDYRILPKHMYGGPKGLGDPMFRGLSKMEEDPMIPQRMRDTIRTQICIAEAAAINDCGKEMGVRDVLKCRPQRDALLACSHKWMENGLYRPRKPTGWDSFYSKDQP